MKLIINLVKETNTIRTQEPYSSIGELLLLIYKSGFYRWKEKQPLEDNHDPQSNHMSKPHSTSCG